MRGEHPARVRAAVGRADLARLVAGLPPDRAARAAALLGFEERDARQASLGPMPAPSEASPSSAPASAPASAVQRQAVPMPFWRLEEMKFIDPPERNTEGPVITDEMTLTQDDLTSPGHSLFATPRPTPLAAWSRLWPILRDALQTSAPGREPDVPALLRHWSRGRFVGRVPRVPRRVWAGRASVWIDRSPRLVPFWSDQAGVYRRLRAACGTGLEVRLLDARTQAWAMTRSGDLRPGFKPDPETPVLVLGDLGAYGSPAERAAWLRTARGLRAAGVRVAALVPAPRARWDAAAARAWAAVPWERGQLAAARQERGSWQARAERLLRLVSPAAFVQPGLLRALRLLLPARDTDAATEVDAWSHPDVCAADATGLVLHPEAALRWRQQFEEDTGDRLKVRVRDAIKRWHEGLPKELLRVETLAWLSLIPPELAEGAEIARDRDDALGFASRLEASSRQGFGDPRPEAAAVRLCARKMLLPMPAAVYRAVPALKIVWAAAFKDVTGVRVPEGLKPLALYEELERGGEPRWWAARQVGSDLVFSPSQSAVWPSHDRGPGSPVAWLLAERPHLYVRRGEEVFETKLVLDEGLSLPLRAGETLALRSDRCAITLGCWSREPWAVAAGRDRFGLWADAEMKDVVLRFRWIPPGRFRMGSPESEAGRWEDEGPRHSVTWTRGRWLCDAPVTQALWQAVMSKNPSHFVSPDRPVERVSWNDCQEFLRGFNDLAPGLDGRLPSEAEWEHACRAGTETATWLGDLEILGENNAPLLDAIAWYGDNSDQESHPVKHKAPNPLGLFDMLGNVYEWCLDASKPFSPEKYSTADVIDPLPNKAGSGRVCRGGSWRSDARRVRAARRNAGPPEGCDGYLGFRLARGQESGRGAEPRDAERPKEPGRGTRPGSGPKK